jgi:hypothetical protein
VIDIDHELCVLAGQNMQLEVRTDYRTETGASESERSLTRLFLPTLRCTGICPEPEPQTYNVFLPGLGQDQCPDRTTDDCELRRRTLGARATIDVTWVSEGDGGRTEWIVGTTGDEASEPEASDVARFDEFAYPTTTLSPDGFSGSARITLKWDRQVDYTAQLVGACFGGTPGGPAPSPITGTARPAGTGVFAADVTFYGLCPGETYSYVVTYTDEGGVTQTSAGPGAAGVTPVGWWPGGTFVMQERLLELTVKMEIFRADGLTNHYKVRDSWVYIGAEYGASPGSGGFSPSFGDWQHERCFALPRVGSDPSIGSVRLKRTYDIVPGINLFSDVGRYPLSTDCSFAWPVRYEGWTNSSVTLSQILAGVTVSGDLRWDPVHDDNTPADFRYRISIRGEYADE